MTRTLFIHAMAALVSLVTTPNSNLQAQGNRVGQATSIVVGTLKQVDTSGTKLSVQQIGENTRELYIIAETKIFFVGWPAFTDHKPKVGLGVKASCEKDGLVRTISFTPPVGEPTILGDERLTMNEPELFKMIDKDFSKAISYVEFSKYIYHSPKHSPDSFRKADQNRNGSLDRAEFTEALSGVSWWKLSRQTPSAWFLSADENSDGMLDIKEFAGICMSRNHIGNIFKRTDEDKSGGLSARETTTYIRSITHAETKRRVKR